jgi:hypothetical protein
VRNEGEGQVGLMGQEVGRLDMSVRKGMAWLDMSSGLNPFQVPIEPCLYG